MASTPMKMINTDMMIDSTGRLMNILNIVETVILTSPWSMDHRLIHELFCRYFQVVDHFVGRFVVKGDMVVLFYFTDAFEQDMLFGL